MMCSLMILHDDFSKSWSLSVDALDDVGVG